MWNLREKEELSMAPSLGKRNSKGGGRIRLEVNWQIVLGYIKFQMIPGHPGRGNLQASGHQRVGSGTKMGLDH